MRTALLEFAAGHGSATIAAQLAAAGVTIAPGHDPVPLRGAGEGTTGGAAAGEAATRGAANEGVTVVVTVLVPSGVAIDRLREIPGVVRVSVDPVVAPLG